MNISILCKPTEQHFITPYVTGLKEQANVRISGTFDLIAWADVLIIEIAHELAQKYSNFITTSPRPYTIVRCIDAELASPVFENINWDNIDCVWFINRQTQEDFLKRVKPKDYFYLPTAIDVSKFPFIKKSYGKNIVMFSLDHRPRKNYINALHFFKKLLEYDDEFRLFIKAMPKPTEFNLFIETIKELKLEDYVILNFLKINLSKLDDKSDLIKYLADKDIFLSYSAHEAFHYALAESMLLGLKGYCRQWEWGRPQDFWGQMLCENDVSLIKMILRFSALPAKEKLAICRAERKYVIEKFGHKKLSQKLLEILDKKIRYE